MVVLKGVAVNLWALGAGRSAVVTAAWSGHSEVVDHLLKARADVDAPDGQGPGEAAAPQRAPKAFRHVRTHGSA
eukprot:10713351-Heterocapsa_arctica.AAC.1